MKLCCWWCTCDFSTKPLALPIDYNYKTNVFSTVGTFCSWNCMKAYNYNKNDCKKFVRSSFILMLQKSIEDNISTFDIAPPKQCLKKFGGKMTIDEFRKNSSTIYQEIPNNIIHTSLNIEKQVNFKWIDKNEANMNFNNINNKQIKTDQMKIKKDKRKSSVNNSILEHSMGIFPLNP